MTLRSPLSRVRGLGSAKDGTSHFWAQRVTAIALIPLTFMFVVVIFNVIGADHARAVTLMGNPVVAVTMLLFIIAGFYHSQLGLRVVIEDYIHHEAIKTLSLLAVSLGTFALGTASVFAILKLAFGG